MLRFRPHGHGIFRTGKMVFPGLVVALLLNEPIQKDRREHAQATRSYPGIIEDCICVPRWRSGEHNLWQQR
uniref:Uncharacterized protein n=1 Tax=mine drainage metagenome TaxID=410659 RepID=E6PZR8_9ZZZZ